jgi:hypothetical protein
LSSKRAPGFASAALLALGLATALPACSAGAKARGGPARAEVPAIDRRVDPAEIFPADLDLVVRLDVARMRSSIGPAAASAMAARAAREAGDDVLRAALACADVVWLGARVTDLDAGDHVVVVEGPSSCTPELDRAMWRPEPSRNKSVKVFDRVDPARRAGTARILVLGPQATAFVSPMEVDSLTRILAVGPDEKRGNPVAEGVVSLDVRAGRLPPQLEQKYPSIAAILAGLERVRGTAVVVDEGVQIDVQILSPTAKGAEKALRFLTALRDNVEDPRVALVIRKVSIEQIEGTLRIRLLLPGKVALALLSAQVEEPAK